MKLIIESGATKTDWCAKGPDGSEKRVKTAGINLATMSMDAIRPIVDEAVAALEPENLEAIHFYAAGIVSRGSGVPEEAKGLDWRFEEMFPGVPREFASDLLGAARAVCGHGPGIAGILGTGSNSCFYDGEKIVKNISSGGFILGDEGGGAVLGKLFVADFLKNQMPEYIAKDFASRYQADYPTIVKNVYRGNAPSGYLGQFAPYILSFYGKDEYVTRLVENNFKAYIDRSLKQYDIDRYQVGIVGGFGYACRDILRKVGAVNGVTFSRIMPSPFEGLIEYHQS